VHRKTITDDKRGMSMGVFDLDRVGNEIEPLVRHTIIFGDSKKNKGIERES